ncbi:hypothetical protein [Bradyrhizobium cenepequi]
MSSIAGGAPAAPTLLARAAADGAKLRAVILLIFFGLYFFSLYKVSQLRSTYHVGFSEDWLNSALVPICLTAVIAVAFVLARFSFGYFAGFYLFAMMAGYFWVNAFSLLDYDHNQALFASAASIVAFLLPALTIRSDVVSPRLPAKLFDRSPDVILVGSAFLLIWCALDGFHLVSFDEMEKYRSALDRPRVIQYAIGNVNGALIPFAIAYALSRGRRWIAAWLSLVSLLYFPITLTKTAIFAAPFIIFMSVVSSRLEPRISVILSLLVPLSIGVLSVAGVGEHNLSVLRHSIFGLLNFRLLAIPSSSLDHYFEFFHHHQLTHFCQVSLLNPLMTCPYTEQLGVTFANEYGMGNMNASLFATEGVASVGPVWMPLAALASGLVLAIANKTSAGLAPRFVLISGAIVPITLMNVPLSTTLLSNGLALLMLLWWLTPREAIKARFG